MLPHEIISQNFIVSATNNAYIETITGTEASTDTVILSVSNDNSSINEPIIFSDFIISGASSTTFGGLTAGTTYYFRVKAVGSSTVYGGEKGFTTTK